MMTGWKPLPSTRDRCGLPIFRCEPKSAGRPELGLGRRTGGGTIQRFLPGCILLQQHRIDSAPCCLSQITPMIATLKAANTAVVQCASGAALPVQHDTNDYGILQRAAHQQM